MHRVKHYINLIKFEHSIFSLPFIYSGAIIVNNTIPSLWLMILITIAGISARTSAMTINRIIDIEIDRRNPRTSSRELPAGKISLSKAYILTVISFSILMLSAFLINFLVFYLAPILVLLFVVYPYLKRYTKFAHFFLGFILGISPIAGALSVTGSFDISRLLGPAFMGLAVMFWVAGFDIIYSLLDVDSDKKQGLHSFPADTSVRTGLKVAALSHALMVIFLFISWYFSSGGLWFLVGIIISALLLITEHASLNPQDAEKINRSFFQINAYISVGLLIFILADILT